MMPIKAPATAVAYLRSVGAVDIRVEPGGKHPRLIFEHDGRKTW
jgi:hypothetical protein